jgi:hypothetical protein
MISFITPTALPIEAATTMGVSVKESDHAIGKFGTGLKYAIAGVLRLGGTITIHVDGERHDFRAVDTSIRGRAFRIVHCNGVPCGFTTELGKHWEPWQLFRELASNALDEGGRWQAGVADPKAAATVIHVDCRAVVESEQTEHVFLGKRRALLESSNGAQVFDGASRHYYFNGIRAGSFGGMAPVSVNVTCGKLSEDRLLDLATVNRELAWAFRTATRWDHDLLLSVLPSSDPTDFWVKHVCPYSLAGAELPPDLLDFMAARPKYVKHPGLRQLLEAHGRKGGSGRWTAVEPTPRFESLLTAGETLCRAVGVDSIPREKARLTADLGDRELAVTCLDTREVWFSTKLAMLGRDEFLCGYLEEALHAMTGYHDCTREFQNSLLSILVANHTNALAEAA